MDIHSFETSHLSFDLTDVSAFQGILPLDVHITFLLNILLRFVFDLGNQFLYFKLCFKSDPFYSYLLRIIISFEWIIPSYIECNIFEYHLYGIKLCLETKKKFFSDQSTLVILKTDTLKMYISQSRVKITLIKNLLILKRMI